MVKDATATEAVVRQAVTEALEKIMDKVGVDLRDLRGQLGTLRTEVEVQLQGKDAEAQVPSDQPQYFINVGQRYQVVPMIRTTTRTYCGWTWASIGSP